MAKKITLVALTLIILVAGVIFFTRNNTTLANTQPAIALNRSDDENRQSSEKIMQTYNWTSESIVISNDSLNMTINYPIANNKTIDNAISKWFNSAYNDFEKQTADLKKQDAFNADISNGNIDFLLYEYENYITIEFLGSYKLGNSEKSDSIKTFVFDIETGKPQTLSTLFKKNSNYLALLSALAKKELLLNDSISQNKDATLIAEGTAQIESNFSLFALTNDGMLLLFNPGQVADDELGVIRILISFNDLKSVLINPKIEIQTQSLTETIPPANDVIISPDVTQPEQTQPDQTAQIQDDATIQEITPVDDGKKYIAITFDDGPSGQKTRNLLEVLDKHQVKATFFVVGEKIKNGQTVLKETYDAGHEIGSHSYSHKDFNKISDKEVIDELVLVNEEIYKVLNLYPNLFRPPYGVVGDNLDKLISDQNLFQIFWSIDTLDWKSKHAKIIYDHVIENIKEGDIILLHDSYDSSVEAADKIIETLKKDNYEFVTISELAKKQGIELKTYTRYRNFYN